MVYVPKYKKPSGKGKTKKPMSTSVRGYKRPPPTSQVPRSLAVLGNGFPRKLKCVHTYHQSAQLVSTGGSLASQMNRCNGMYDPDATAAGHQPLYFDQLNALYNHFCVIGSKITYYFSHSATTNLLVQVTSYINDDTTLSVTNLDNLAEQVSAKTVIIPAGSNNRYKISQSWSAKKFFGKPVLGNKALTGSGTADPTEQSVYVLSAAQPGGASANIDVQVEIEYIAIWSELKEITGS